jgi:single-strand DNA-binding protein
VVTGRVRRRFFRSGGATASRTEVVAERVIPARQVVRVAKALACVADQISP